MIFVDILKKYNLTIGTVMVLSVVGVVLWRLYDRVYAPLFIRSQVTVTAEATQFHVPEEVITQALQQLQNKQMSPVHFDTVTTQLTPQPTAAATLNKPQALTEGITIDATAP